MAARIAEQRLRPIKIHRLNGRERYLVGVQQAFNLPDAVRGWYAQHAPTRGYWDPLFQANTVTLRTVDGQEEVYVATD